MNRGYCDHSGLASGAQHGDSKVMRIAAADHDIQTGFDSSIELPAIVMATRPVPPERHGRGFGNVLLAAVLEKQLGGSIDRTWRNGGLRLRIQLPSLDRVGGGLRHKP